MTHSVQGVVDSAFTKTKSTTKGDKIINYITVDGVEISTGFKAAHTSGQHINIAVKFNYGEWQKIEGKTGDGLPPCPGGKPVTSVGTMGATKTGGRGKFPIDPMDGQMSIIRQSSLNRAVELVRDMVSSGVVAIPVDHAEYMKLVLEMAMICTDFGSGQDIMKLKAAMASNELVANG